MHLYEVLLIAVALSIDACAITIANCTACKMQMSKKQEWAMPVTFAVFQGVMPLIGYFVGSLFSGYIGAISKFISAGIFFILAAKIVVDVVKEKIEEKKVVEVCEIQSKSKFSLWLLLLQGVATSIDALAIGITFIDLTFSVFVAAAVISIITFAFVALALVFGKALGKVFGKYAEWVGAVILLILAIKSLIEALA